MFILFNKSGGALISSLIAGLLGVVSLAYMGQSIAGAARSGRIVSQTVVADAYAAELLEFFMSNRSGRLKTYLSTNPINTAFPGYPLCTFINQDNSGGTPSVLNRDPLAELGNSELAGASRDYRVEVVDLSNPNNLTSRGDLCGRDPATVTLGANEAYWLSVNVHWKNATGATQHVELAGVIPR